MSSRKLFRTCVVALVAAMAAVAAQVFLGHTWFRAVLYEPVRSGKFTSAGGQVIFELLFGLPFYLSLVVGGFVLSRSSGTPKRGLLYSLGLGVLAALLFSLLYRRPFSAFTIFPLFFSVIGSLVSRVVPVRLTK